MEAPEGGVEVTAPPPPVPEAAPKPRGIGVGDTIYIKGGQLNETRGKLYGFQKDRFSILPAGVSDRLIHIPVINGKPDPDLNIEQVLILQRAVKPGFVFLTNLHVDAYVETFAANGEPAGNFYVTAVDEEKDSATFQVLDEEGKRNSESEEFTIVFGFKGIPRDLPYEVIRIREPPAIVSEQEGTAAEDKAPSLVVDDDDQQEAATTTIQGEDEDENDDDGDEIIIQETDIDVEVSKEGDIVELSSSEKIFDDATQRSEMLVQLIRLLPQAKQRDEKELQRIRRLVEVFMHMRNRVVKYGVTGEPRGLQQTTAQNLVDLIKSPNTPMVKKVAAVTKILYIEHSLKHKRAYALLEEQVYGEKKIPFEADFYGDLSSNDSGVPEGHLVVDYLEDVLERTNELLEKQNKESENEIMQMGMPKFYRDMQTFIHEVLDPFVLENGVKQVPHDEEVFRQVIPDIASPELFVREEGRPYKFPPVITQTAVGTARLLAPRKVESMVVEKGDAPVVSNFLVFPKQAQRELGPLRTGSLARDVATSMLPARSMAALLQSIKPIDDHPTVKDIINIGVKGQLGNINLADWLRELALPISGVGEAYTELQGYGMRDFEFSREQMAILQELIQQHLAAIKLYLIRQREENASHLSNLKYTPQPLLPDSAAQVLLDTIAAEPILQEILKDSKNAMGDLYNVDLNWFAFVFFKNPDLVSAVLGKGATLETQQAVVRERNRVVRDRALESLALGFRLRKMRREQSQPAAENKCPHVAELQGIRRAAQKEEGTDSQEVKKMKLLLQVLAKYRGKTENNWVSCKLCKQHLLCGHELMRIQEFIKPKERDVLHKELILKFSGGQFSGKFICRVCGQGIQDLDFDTHMEFDDEGRPMMGRAVMEDEAGIEEEELQILLGGDADLIEEVNFGTAELNQMYRTFHDLARQIGIQPEEADYRVMVQELSTYLKTLKPADRYAQAKKLAEAKGRQVADYPVYVAIRYASAACAILLLSIQTRIPDYVIYYSTSECEDGFMGYPLTTNEETNAGVNCIVNVAAAIESRIYPWDTTTLQNVSDVEKRKTPFRQEVMKRLEELLKIPTVQAKLQKKRDYMQTVLGKEETGGALEVIPSTFRPIPFKPITKEEAAAEAALATVSPAHTWIRNANLLAIESAKINPKSPFSVATCCLHNIKNPNEFWSAHAADLPALEARTLGKPNWRSTTSRTTFFTSPIELLEGTLNPDEYFKLFARVCYEGPNVGLPHEFGFTMKCTQCGIFFQQDPALVSVNLDEKARAEKRLLSNLEEQGIVINEKTFQNLLHTSQRRQEVRPDLQAPPPDKSRSILQLADIEYFPIEDWPVLLQQVQVNLRELEAAQELGNDEKLFTASEELQNRILACERQIQIRLGNSIKSTIDSILTRSPREVGTMLRTYLLVPFQRWLSGITQDNFYIPRSYELSPETKEDILMRGLGEHLKPIGQNDFTSVLKGLIKRKVEYFIRELSYFCNHVFPTLRSMTTLGGATIVDIFMRAFCMGPICRLINPNDIPPGDEEIETGVAQADSKQLLRKVAICFTKYAKGSYIPSNEEIKLKLEQRQEAENQKFVKKLDKMSKDRRQVELVNKRLGIGDWAVGGTRAIMEYDPARYLEERLERYESGLKDYDEGNMNDTDYQQVRDDDF